MEIFMKIWSVSKEARREIKLDRRTGLRLRCDRDLNPEVKRACKAFCAWLRKNYEFPIRVPVYLKATEFIKARDGEHVSATFFGPFDRSEEPYIRVSEGDYVKDVEECGQDNALAGILHSIAHELTHYYQWLNRSELSEDKEEAQAVRQARRVIRKYAETREHP